MMLRKAWAHAFDDQVTRGTQHKFQHITFRTLLRPRDVIQFANLALTTAKNRLARDETADLRISNDDLKEARQAYSTYFRLEFDDEIGEASPDWDTTLEVLRSIGSAKFTLEEFRRGYSDAGNKARIPINEEEVLPFLYEYSIVGFEKTRNTGSGFTYHFKYQGDTVRFDPQASSFLVHRGLKEALDLTETS